MEETKVWQTRIWTGKKYETPITIDGISLVNLRDNAQNWLRKNHPLDFSSASPSSSRSGRVSYVYSDGTLMPALPLDDFYKGKILDEGWYYIEYGSGRPRHLNNYDEVIKHFVEQSLIYEKGPDYKEIPLVESEVPLHMLHSVKHESDEDKINDMLQRGWLIIAIEFDGSTTYDEKLVKRHAKFVLGHVEENAF
jgi:hypothetical protein